MSSPAIMGAGTADTDRDSKGGPPAGESAEARRAKRLRAKNLTLLVALLTFVALIYFVSIVRMGGS